MDNANSTRRLAALFSRWGATVGRYPARIATLGLLVSALLILQAHGLVFDTSFESFLAEDHTTRVALDQFRDQFGRGEPVVVAVRVPNGLGDPAFLERLAALHADLEEEVVYLDRITSLVNVRATRPSETSIEIGELLADWPETPEALAGFERFVEHSALYANYLVGEAGSGPAWTAIVLEAETHTDVRTPLDIDATAPASLETDLVAGFDDGFAADAEFEQRTPAEERRRLTSMDDAEMLHSVEAVLVRHREAGLEIELAGSLVVGEVVSRTIKADFGRLLGIAALAIGALLYLVFRKVSVSVLVLSVVLLSLGGSLGAMARLGVPVGFGTQILPAFLLAAGVGYAVHVVTLFRHALGTAGASAKPTRAERASAIRQALDHAGPPILLTALTTIGGLVSFASTELAPIVQLGLIAPIGISLAALYSVVLLPALLVLLPLRITPAARSSRPAVGAAAAPTATGVEALVARVGLWAADHRAGVLAVLVVALFFSALGITRLGASHHPLGWLPDDWEITAATDRVDAELGGASVLEVMLTSRVEGGFRTPDLLQRLELIEADILAFDRGANAADRIRVGKVVGLHTVVRELNQALEGGAEASYRVPDDAQLVAQELVLFENSGLDDVEELVDSTYTTARLSVRVNYADAFYSTPFARRIEAIAARHLEGHATARVTGMYDLKTAVFVHVVESLKRSYAIAFFVVAGLLVLMVGDLRIGLAALIPNMSPILVAMGVMGFLEIPLGVYTMLVGSIAMGLAVDDTIHMAHGFVRFERAGASPREAMRRSLSTAGVAVLFTSAALVSGFAVFGFATLSSLLDFGVVTSISIVAALVADLVVSPALFVWVAEARQADGRDADHGALEVVRDAA